MFDDDPLTETNGDSRRWRVLGKRWHPKCRDSWAILQRSSSFEENKTRKFTNSSENHAHVIPFGNFSRIEVGSYRDARYRASPEQIIRVCGGNSHCYHPPYEYRYSKHTFFVPGSRKVSIRTWRHVERRTLSIEILFYRNAVRTWIFCAGPLTWSVTVIASGIPARTTGILIQILRQFSFRLAKTTLNILSSPRNTNFLGVFLQVSQEAEQRPPQEFHRYARVFWSRSHRQTGRRGGSHSTDCVNFDPDRSNQISPSYRVCAKNCVLTTLPQGRAQHFWGAQNFFSTNDAWQWENSLHPSEHEVEKGTNG